MTAGRFSSDVSIQSQSFIRLQYAAMFHPFTKNLFCYKYNEHLRSHKIATIMQFLLQLCAFPLASLTFLSHVVGHRICVSSVGRYVGLSVCRSVTLFIPQYLGRFQGFINHTVPEQSFVPYLPQNNFWLTLNKSQGHNKGQAELARKRNESR